MERAEQPGRRTEVKVKVAGDSAAPLARRGLLCSLAIRALGHRHRLRRVKVEPKESRIRRSASVKRDGRSGTPT